MDENKDITKYLLGTRDPFEGISESSVFKQTPKVYEQVIKVPKADVVRVGILSEGKEQIKLPDTNPQAQQKVKGFKSLLLEREEGSQWICGEIDPAGLDAFLLGLSEYLCDDFGLKSIPESVSAGVRYPSDGNLRLSWSPKETHLELVLDGDVYQKKLNLYMINELRQIGDFLLQNAKEIVHLSPPLPRYILEDPKRKQQQSLLLLVTFSVMAFIAAYLGICRRGETQRALSNVIDTAQGRIAEVIKRR